MGSIKESNGNLDWVMDGAEKKIANYRGFVLFTRVTPAPRIRGLMQHFYLGEIFKDGKRIVALRFPLIGEARDYLVDRVDELMEEAKAA